MEPFTLLTDFDGVWTDPLRELAAVSGFLTAELARFGGVDAARSVELYARFRADVMARPSEHGWRIDGRLVSYVDEDVFAEPTAVGQWIEAARCADTARLRAAILSEYPSVLAFLDHCYHSTCARFREEVPHDLTRGAERVLHWFLRERIPVVFASNAPFEKVAGWFACHGLQVADARDSEPGAAPLRAYGRAGKQCLGAAAESLVVGGREVPVDRPQYRAILERERAALVVGDVFSLDLAVPLAMRRARAPGAPRALGLMHLEHTPRWLLDEVGRGGVDYLVSHVSALPRLVNALR
ncbi:MAG: hypothetical protein O3A20_06470 [Planctomycetota bacterium]|nr:hypothetical protein [Planctomycetota bacterium]